jgi:hypothetical protein
LGSRFDRSSREQLAHADEVIGNNTETNPPLHAVLPTIAAAIQTVPQFQYADTTFASGPPALASFKPAALVPLPSSFAPGVPAGMETRFSPLSSSVLSLAAE